MPHRAEEEWQDVPVQPGGVAQHDGEVQRDDAVQPGDAVQRNDAAGLPDYTLGEEIANSVTHGFGAVLSVAGLVLLLLKAVLDGGRPELIVGAAIFWYDARTRVLYEYALSCNYQSFCEACIAYVGSQLHFPAYSG